MVHPGWAPSAASRGRWHRPACRGHSTAEGQASEVALVAWSTVGGRAEGREWACGVGHAGERISTHLLAYPHLLQPPELPTGTAAAQRRLAATQRRLTAAQRGWGAPRLVVVAAAARHTVHLLPCKAERLHDVWMLQLLAARRGQQARAAGGRAARVTTRLRASAAGWEGMRRGSHGSRACRAGRWHLRHGRRPLSSCHPALPPQRTSAAPPASPLLAARW